MDGKAIIAKERTERKARPTRTTRTVCKIRLAPFARPWLETPEQTEEINRFYGIE